MEKKVENKLGATQCHAVAKMKHIIILGDGMADWPVKSLGGKTLLQYAHTPYMDMLARMGRSGRLMTVPDGFHPGSEVANMSVMIFSFACGANDCNFIYTLFQ